MARILLALAALSSLTLPSWAVHRGRAPTPDESVVRGASVELLRDGGRHFCGGTLVDPLVVLTAVHCLQGGGGEYSMPPALRFFTADGGPGEYRVPVNVRLLRRYADAVDGDLALILLDREAPGSAAVAALFDGAPPHHAETLVSGAGLTETGGFQGLRVAETVLGFLDGGNFVLSDLTGRSGGCPGDSGGGAYLLDGKVPKLLGVNSSVPGSKDCSRTGPTSVASVIKDRSWIDETVARFRTGRHGREGDSDARTVDLLSERRERVRRAAERGKGSLGDLFRRGD